MPTGDVRIVGDAGQPVVLLPGGAEASDGFFPGLIEGLRADPGCRVILYDRPGTGTSSVAGSLAGATTALKATVDEMGLGPVVVVGQSLGGAVAALLARDHPDVVSGLVLLDPTPINDPGSCAQIARTMRVLEKANAIPVVDRVVSGLLRASLARSRRKMRLRPDCEAAHERLSELDVPKLARATDGIVELAAGFRESDLPRLPSVVVTADRKPGSAVRRAHARLAGALGGSIVSWPAATHDVHLSHPDETLETVRDLVRRCSAAAM